MNLISYDLRATNPEKNVFRFYKLCAGKDLFGHWSVTANYGRQGTKGQVKGWTYNTLEEAQKHIEVSLKKRDTAQKRIGVNYVVKEYSIDI